MIYRAVRHHWTRQILGAMRAGRSKLSMHGDQPLSSWDYIFIENHESGGTLLYSHQVLDKLFEMMVYCYGDQCDRSQNTPPLTRVNYLAADNMRHWAHYPSARIGHMHIRSARNVAYSERCEGSEGGAANDRDTSHISETSSHSRDSGDLSQSLLNLFLPRNSAS